MSNLIFFDDEHWVSLLPLSYTKPCCELRVGIRTIRDKWEASLSGTGSFICKEYLSAKFPIRIDSENLIINGRLLPNDRTLQLIRNLELNQALIFNDNMIAARLDEQQLQTLGAAENQSHFKAIDISSIASEYIQMIERPFDIMRFNASEIQKDVLYLTTGRQSNDIHKSNTCFGQNQIFIEKGASVRCSILDAENGPIYIAKNASVMEGAIIKGPFALGENSTVKMAAKIYAGVSTGPHCKIGGELGNSSIQGFSNKGHDGYLGDSVLGEWCNLGADTNNSNLKNNYAEVKVWHYGTERFEKSGLQFCGLTMGDHSKSAINTMFNTGTVVGVAANVFGHGFPRNFIPSFSWGGYQKMITFQFEKALTMMESMMSRRNKTLDQFDIDIYQHIFTTTSTYRSWEKNA